MRFLESFSTFFTTVRFIIFSGIIVFFVFVNTMSSEMHRGWQNFLTNFARNFQQISFKKGYFLYAGRTKILSKMAILNIVLIANTDYEEKQSSQMAKELILNEAFLGKKW